MKMEDYNKFYIQGSDHYLIPKDVFMELFNEMINWKEENKQLQEELECTIGIVEHNRIISKKNKEIHQLKDNWNKLKEAVINDINFWEEQEKKWIELGFIKFGGEANNKIIFKKVLNKMQELQGSDSNE